MTRHWLLSCDPGLDRVAFALWRIEGFRGTPSADLARAAERLCRVWSVSTDPKDDLAIRLAQLATASEDAADVPQGLMVGDIETLRAVVELPAITGDYRRNAGSGGRPKTGKAMQGSLLATGAIAAGLLRWATSVNLEPASRTRRETKQLVGRRVIELAAKREPDKDWPSNDDTRSAVYIGLTADWFEGAE